jgi:hypothetical protein
MDLGTVDLRGLAAARAVSQWYIGDPSWANTLIDAYLNPERALAELEADRG